VSSYEPWFVRGAAHYNGLDTGVFAFDNENGRGFGNESFRVVISYYSLK